MSETPPSSDLTTTAATTTTTSSTTVSPPTPNNPAQQQQQQQQQQPLNTNSNDSNESNSNNSPTAQPILRRRSRHHKSSPSQHTKSKRRRSEITGSGGSSSSNATTVTPTSPTSSSTSSSSCSSSSESSCSSDEDELITATAAPTTPSPSTEETTTTTTVMMTSTDDDDNDDNAATNNTTNDENSSPPSSPSSSPSSPTSPSSPSSSSTPNEGWRVKLYRLNADGSWDDCGTGRIKCLTNSNPEDDDDNEEGNNNSSEGDGEDEAIEKELGRPTLCMHAEQSEEGGGEDDGSEGGGGEAGERVLLRTKILLREAYQRQGDNIITWCEPFFEGGGSGGDGGDGGDEGMGVDEAGNRGVDLALSFQDNAGCLDIWQKITSLQHRAASLLSNPASASSPSNTNSSSLLSGNKPSSSSIYPSTDDNLEVSRAEVAAAAVAAARHALFQHQNMWNVVGNSSFEDDASFVENATTNGTGHPSGVSNSAETDPCDLLPSDALPSPPSLSNLEEIADKIAAGQMSHRDGLARYLSLDDCSYVKKLLGLFGPAEREDDFRSLATLAACIKSVLLLNDPHIVEWAASDAKAFEDVCSALEYDPDLRVKANHRWFIRHRAKFRTLVKMEDEELIDAIHRSFRVTYLRDTLLRPTMDEGSLSTLAGLLQFTHSEVVRGVMGGGVAVDGVEQNEEKAEAMANPNHVNNNCNISDHLDEVDEISGGVGRVEVEEQNHAHFKQDGDCYLVKVLRMLGVEVREIRLMGAGQSMDISGYEDSCMEVEPNPNPNNSSERYNRYERYDHQSHPTISNPPAQTPSDTQTTTPHSPNSSQSIWQQHLFPQDSSLTSRLLRRTGCLSFLRELFTMVRHSLQQSAKDDFYTMICLMDVKLSPSEETVNLLTLLGAILSDKTSQVSERSASLEILSAIAMHDAALIRRHCLDNFNNFNGNTNQNIPRPQPNAEQEFSFPPCHDDLLLSILYLLSTETDAGLLLPTSEIMRIILDTEMMDSLPVQQQHQQHSPNNPHQQPSCPTTGAGTAGEAKDQNSFLSLFYEHYANWLVAPFQWHLVVDGKKVPNCAIRTSFAVELLGFCVRAHCYRMKIFVLRNGVLKIVLHFLHSNNHHSNSSNKHDNPNPNDQEGGDRCLKLAALRFLRSVISVKDEFYHRHIMQNNLFQPVFDAFRNNPVGDNLVSSSIIEMCDFIRTKNIKTLLEHIVTKHLDFLPGPEDEDRPTLEDVAGSYVDTLTLLRKKHEENVKDGKNTMMTGIMDDEEFGEMGRRVILNQKAIDDQRKFRETEEEESYFESDDDDINVTINPKQQEAQPEDMECVRHYLGLPTPNASPAKSLIDVMAEDGKESSDDDDDDDDAEDSATMQQDDLPKNVPSNDDTSKKEQHEQHGDDMEVETLVDDRQMDETR